MCRVDTPRNYECPRCRAYVLQSDEADISILDGSSAPTTTTATVAEFLDETPGGSWSIPSVERSNLNDRQPEVELAQFLSRPVLIKTHVWAQTDAYNVGSSWFPWYEFFNSTPIKNKLNNYSFISCTLKVKFVVNASPFYAGAMAFCYSPLQGLADNTIITDAGGGELLGYSQRPKVWIFPQTCQGGEIELPFFYHKNWLDITDASETQRMGLFNPALFARLVSATGVTGTSIVIHAYAWAENVKLHAPTTKLALQSDEYDYKPSQIASSIASASSKLSRIPLIGPYMTATSVVASGISSIASALGFTNVPSINTVDTTKLSAYPNNSTCDISVPSDRSSVDPKNEVTIDPRTVGLDGKDELDIAYIAGRESYLGNAILSSTDSVDTLTLVSRVTPALIYQYSSSTPIQYTPCGYLGEMFDYWRGDIIFRFKFICTRFHKGRVRITFDPTGNISTTVPDYTTVFNEVVDIGAEQDIEVRVPYMQATTYLHTSNQTGNYNFSGSSLTPSSSCNGLITMRVVNPLSGPVANTAIPVMVFVRAADNIEYAGPFIGPRGISNTLSPYTLQSDEVTYGISPTQVLAGVATVTSDPQRNKIHFGERLVSLRPLIHRLMYQYTLKSTILSTDVISINSFYSSRRLKYSGFDPNGILAANKVLGVGVAPYNFQKMNIHQLVSLMFVGQRGSMNWSFNLESSVTNPTSNLTVKRYPSNIGASSYTVKDTATVLSQNQTAQVYNSYFYEPTSGMALTDQRHQPGIVMNFPYYSQYNFQFVSPENATIGAPSDGTDVDNILCQVFTQKVATSDYDIRLNTYAACGHDYNFFFFQIGRAHV